MLGKISRLPSDVRDHLNQRLADGQPAAVLLPWLNSLPEVNTILARYFDGQPISEQNLSDYRTHGFRRWQIRQEALQFAADETTSSSPSSAQLPASPLVDHLVHWIATRFAAAAQTAPISDDPEADLREIRAFLGDIVALRRGDLIARRLGLEQQRIALDQAKSQEELEKLFGNGPNAPTSRLGSTRTATPTKPAAMLSASWTNTSWALEELLPFQKPIPTPPASSDDPHDSHFSHTSHTSHARQAPRTRVAGHFLFSIFYSLSAPRSVLSFRIQLFKSSVLKVNQG